MQTIQESNKITNRMFIYSRSRSKNITCKNNKQHINYNLINNFERLCQQNLYSKLLKQVKKQIYYECNKIISTNVIK